MLDSAFISALAALAGSIIGGVTSLAATWLSQSAQARMQQLIQAKLHRKELYTAFIDEASKVYADALVTDKAEPVKLVNLYAMTSRMRMLSAPAVVDAAERTIQAIVETYFRPNLTFHDLHDLLASGHGMVDPLRKFSEACRADLMKGGVT
ncbi:MAG TPA: hypothetical protein VED46_00390 [Alphaproteobacteria bacterium]|nr:hypothetical protein [Alphaproteobacteria bacterium]